MTRRTERQDITSRRTPSRALRTWRGLLAGAAALLTVTALSPAAQAAPEPKAPEAFVALSSVDPSIIQEMRYITPTTSWASPSTATDSPCAS